MKCFLFFIIASLLLECRSWKLKHISRFTSISANLWCSVSYKRLVKFVTLVKKEYLWPLRNHTLWYENVIFPVFHNSKPVRLVDWQVCTCDDKNVTSKGISSCLNLKTEAGSRICNCCSYTAYCKWMKSL
jgi:hypothetical protein